MVQKKKNLHLEHVPSDENDLLISMINASDLGWKADTCKLQTHHADYKCDDAESKKIVDDDQSILLIQTESDTKSAAEEMSEEMENKANQLKLEEA